MINSNSNIDHHHSDDHVHQQPRKSNCSCCQTTMNAQQQSQISSSMIDDVDGDQREYQIPFFEAKKKKVREKKSKNYLGFFQTF